MPRGDRTGPAGGGPMTGRRAGYCAGYDTPGYMNPVYGGWSGFGPGWWGGGFRGAGRGGLPWGGGRGRTWGGGRGFGWRYSQLVPYAYPYTPQLTKDQEISELKAQAGYFKDALTDIEKRLGELEKADTED